MKYRIKKLDKGLWTEQDDQVADEEPLQITLEGSPIAVVMRTPGNDYDLVLGFLLTEGILSDIEVLAKIDLERASNHAFVFLKEGVELNVAKFKRNLYSASSCGICGKASIEAVMQSVQSIQSWIEFEDRVILSAPDQLRTYQEQFETTGGLHAAGLFTQTGDVIAVREDVGRHNAVDKVIGSCLAQRLDLSTSFLQLSGRVSFEIIQKALMAGIPAVSAISAPSSLAVDFARETNLQLFGFVRGKTLNQYS